MYTKRDKLCAMIPFAFVFRLLYVLFMTGLLCLHLVVR